MSVLTVDSKLKKRSFDDIKDFGAFDSTTYVWGTLFSGEIIEKKPKSSGSHTIILAFSRVSVVIISAYYGNLITYLEVLDERPPVSGLFDPKVIQIDLYPHTAVLEFHFLFPSQILF